MLWGLPLAEGVGQSYFYSCLPVFCVSVHISLVELGWVLAGGTAIRLTMMSVDQTSPIFSLVMLTLQVVLSANCFISALSPGSTSKAALFASIMSLIATSQRLSHYSRVYKLASRTQPKNAVSQVKQARDKKSAELQEASFRALLECLEVSAHHLERKIRARTIEDLQVRSRARMRDEINHVGRFGARESRC